MSAFDEVPLNYSVSLTDPQVLGMSLDLPSGSAVRFSLRDDLAVEIASVFDEQNRIFVAAVHGPATPANITQALTVLNPATRNPLDVLAIAFAGASIPVAAERKRLSDLGVSVVMGSPQLPPVARARQYAHRLVTLADESPLNARAA